MTSHAIQPIPAVERYFGSPEAKPVIVAGFRRPEGARRGRWEKSSFRKRVSRSWLRQIARSGYTHVQLELDGRQADFSIEELLR